jgi:hypothetical protein
MTGYIFAGIIINFMQGIVTWRFAIQIQGIAQIPIALYFVFENHNFIDVDMKSSHPEDEDMLSSVSGKTPARHHPGHSNPINSANAGNTFRRAKTRIDAVETSNLTRYCQQTYVISTTNTVASYNQSTLHLRYTCFMFNVFYHNRYTILDDLLPY